MRAKRQAALQSEQRNLNQEIIRWTQKEVFAITRKTLADLASTSLEERMGDVLVGRVRALTGAAKEQIATAFKSSDHQVSVHSTFELPPAQKSAIESAVKETFAPDAQVQFETAPELVCGIDLSTNGHKVSWSIADYLATLEKSAGELLHKDAKPDSHKAEAKPDPKAEAQGPGRSVNPRTGLHGGRGHKGGPLNTSPDSLHSIFDHAFDGISRTLEAFTPQLTPREVGTITSVSIGIAKVSGLPGVGFDELVKFPGDLYGIAFNIDSDEIGVVLLGECEHLHAGDEVERTGRVMDVPVGDGLIGRVIDPLGGPLDGKGPVASSQRLPIERPARPIMDRALVSVPLQTGLIVIDALIPIGRGQRELILGDRQTGKSAIAIDTILNQRDQNVLCVYCAIGQRASSVAKVVANLRENGAMDYTVVVVTEGNDPPGLAYIAPYAATSIAEHFMEAGRDVLIVYDDLTHHARAYRELSLLLRRPPVAKRFRATSSTSTRGCWSVPRIFATSCTAARSPLCPSSRPRRRTSPRTFPPISSPSRTARFICRRRSSNWAFFPPSMSASPFRASVARHNGRPTERWRAISSSPMRSSPSWNPSPSSARGWMTTPARSSTMASGSGPSSSNRSSNRRPSRNKSSSSWR